MTAKHDKRQTAVWPRGEEMPQASPRKSFTLRAKPPGLFFVPFTSLSSSTLTLPPSTLPLKSTLLSKSCFKGNRTWLLVKSVPPTFPTNGMNTYNQINRLLSLSYLTIINYKKELEIFTVERWEETNLGTEYLWAVGFPMKSIVLTSIFKKWNRTESIRMHYTHSKR